MQRLDTRKANEAYPERRPSEFLMTVPNRRSSTQTPAKVPRPRGDHFALQPPEAAWRRQNDWVTAFAMRLGLLGAQKRPDELTKLGFALYPHYDLLEPEDFARVVWRRWPVERLVAGPLDPV